MKLSRDILVMLPNWITKSKILEVHWHQPLLVIEKTEISILPDLSTITLTKGKGYISNDLGTAITN